MFGPETRRVRALQIAQAFHRYYGEVVMAIVYDASLAPSTDAYIQISKCNAW